MSTVHTSDMFSLKNTSFISRNLDISSLNEEKRRIIQTVESLLHQKFRSSRTFMAGGCAAFLLGRTSSYTDIDIYVEADENTQKWAKDNCADNHMSKYDYLYQSKWPCCYLKFDGFIFNIIFVEPRLQFSLEARILCILKSFDLTACKVAIHFSSGINPVLVEWKLTDLNFDNVKKKDRIIKYKKRIEKNEKEQRFDPNSLSMLAYTVVVDHDDSYRAAGQIL